MKAINNNVQETICSIELSKLLKEKGFAVNEPCSCGGFPECICEEVRNRYEHVYRPTHSLAIEWIYVNFDIEVNAKKMWRYGGGISEDRKGETFYQGTAHNFNLGRDNNAFILHITDQPHKTRNSAIEDVLLYTLKNLIETTQTNDSN